MRHSHFVHLHTHSEYSLLDGACRINDLIAQALAFKMPALAITDHGSMFGAIRFYQTALKSGIKPIIGSEMYITSGSRSSRNNAAGERNYHLILLAKDEVGYKNLSKLSTISYLEGFYYKPRIDKECLASHSQGLIALSACMQGEIPQLILKQQHEKAIAASKEYLQIFGEGNFYLELQSNGMEEQEEINRTLIAMSKEVGIPLVATNDCHYLKQKDSYAHEVLLGIQTGTTMDDPNRFKFCSNELYFKSPQEMEAAFNQVPDALHNTIAIAEQCNLELHFDKVYLPNYEVPQTKTNESYLAELCQERLDKRYPQADETVLHRLEFELGVIGKMGYAAYFLIVWDFIRQAREMGIPVGPGRGSAAGSIVAYLLGITNLDPLQYGLLFERFLNPERVTMPDIDIDFCYERRDEIIQYVTEKYGKDHVTQIITFGSMLAKGVIRDVGRTLGMPYNEVDQIAKLVPDELKITLERAITLEPKLAEMAKQNPKVAELLEIAKTLEGLPRHASTHAAGVVISAKPLTEYVPLYRNNKEEVTTQFEMSSLEKIGLLKMDFLGLKTLTVISDSCAIIKRTKNIELDIDQIPLDDQDTYQMLIKGKALAIFQLESSGMRDLLRKIKPECFPDIIALLALYRPGPLRSGMVDDYIKRKHKKIKTVYPHPLLENVLKETHGVILYQEQVMQCAVELAGFSIAESDLLRRAMGKKNEAVMDEQREKFVKGAHKQKIATKKAEEIFNLIAQFAGYGFNKSHSAAYALISYQTAYLKTHYPTAFMAAMLSSEMGNTKKVILYIDECASLGITILPPDINESFRKFTVVDEHVIRFGLAAVKNVGESAIDSIVSSRLKDGVFKSIFDFCERVDLRLVNRRVIESFIKSGAFDSFKVKRSQMMNVIEEALELGGQRQQDRQHGQVSFFDDFSQDLTVETTFPDIPEWPESQRLTAEKEVLGFYVTGHPLAKYAAEMKRFTDTNSETVSEKEDNETVTMAGIIASVKYKVTKKGDKMAVLNLEDLKGTIEVLVFPKLYEQCLSLIEEDAILFIQGRLDKSNGDDPKLLASEIDLLENIPQKMTQGVKISLAATGLEDETISKLRKTVKKYPGNCELVLELKKIGLGSHLIKAGYEYRIKPVSTMVKEVEELLGEDSVHFLVASAK